MQTLTEHYGRLSKTNFANFPGISILSKPLVSIKALDLAKRISPSSNIVTSKFVDLMRLSKTGLQYKHLQEIAYISVKAAN